MAKKRRPPHRKSIRKRSAAARGDWGHYLFQDFGLSAVYLGILNEDGTVEAALFGMNTWCSGLIACYGRRFGTKEAFEEAMQERSRRIKPATRFRCREEIAYGLRIRVAAEAELPLQFARWRHLVDPLDEIKLPSHLYRCPECGRGLSDAYTQQILEGVDRRIVFYFPCERCKNSSSGKLSAKYASAKHIEMIQAIESIDEFSVTWDRDNTPLLTTLATSPVHEEAVEKLIADGTILQAACFAIESHIMHTAAISDAIEDRHVSKALQAVISGKLIIDDEDDDSEIVDRLVEVIKQGLDMFKRAMRSKEQARSRSRAALRWVAESVGNHHSGSDPRSYIKFINKFTPM